MSYCIIRYFSCFSLITLKREKFGNNIGLRFSRVGYDNHFAQKSSSLAHISVNHKPKLFLNFSLLRVIKEKHEKQRMIQ